MNYLIYIEHDAENLQFYLWFQDYSARFEKLPASEKVLSPAWNQSQANSEAAGNSPTKRSSTRVNPQAAAVLKDTDFADGKPQPRVEGADPFITPDKTPSLDEKRDVLSEYGSSTGVKSTTASSAAHRSVAEHAFEDAGMQWKPCMS